MNKRIISIFWIVNVAILGVYFVQYFFNQDRVNLLGKASTILYETVLPFFNIALSFVVIGLFFFNTNYKGRVQFRFDKSFRYLFILLLISITLNTTKNIYDPSFLFYFATVVLFAVCSSLNYKEITSPTE